jgi:hypothetical protein
MFCETGLDQPPSHREIGIAWRQLPYGMQVIRQNHERIDRERVTSAGCRDRVSQNVDLLDQQGLASIEQIHREEPATSGNARR